MEIEKIIFKKKHFSSFFSGGGPSSWFGMTVSAGHQANTRQNAVYEEE